MRVLAGGRVPVRVWARDLPEGTEAQLRALAEQPWTVDFVAAMPDAHVAEGVAVGTVFATEHTVVPTALGGDLGCGMSARRLPIEAASLDRRTLERIVEALDRAIPSGDHAHRAPRAVPASLEVELSTRALSKVRERLAGCHLGTLGGGNHFLELDRDPEGGVWLLVHSGSRGLGAAIADHHRRVAGASLAGLDVRAPPGRAYLHDLAFALRFSAENRAALAERAMAVVAEVIGQEASAPPDVDLHHNYVAEETWGGGPRFVHRKGAVAAPEGRRVLVPGSMGTASYLVRGLGNPAAFGSCSHGAGRRLRRKEARQAISPAAFAASMRRVVHPRDRPRLIEEAPAAYRDLGEVLEDQADLVVRELRLEPLAVLKG